MSNNEDYLMETLNYCVSELSNQIHFTDAEFLVLSGADIGDPQAFIRGLWLQVYEGAPMHLRSSVLRRLHALSRHLGVHYVHGEYGASA